jgi:AP-4 complex subunit epsilon-1
MASGGLSLSKEFFELLKAIGESKSKQEEDRIIMREVQKLKHKTETPITQQGSPLISNSRKLAKEFLVRLLYVEMLGHDASFGYIKAVEMAASASLYHKRTGYLVCGACLPPTHEFRFMLVNQMQRDLQSPNVLECSGGLLAATSIITGDMVPAVSTEVVKLLSHDSPTIRKKAIIALHRFHQLAPEVVTKEELQNQLRKVLCDKDPSVMGSCLNVIQWMARGDPLPFKELVPSLVSILKQIGDHRLPSDYDYHRVPAPWMQIQLVRILGILGRGDVAASEGMYQVLRETMKNADNGINAGYAISYECIKTIVSIYPNPALLDLAAESISRVRTIIVRPAPAFALFALLLVGCFMLCLLAFCCRWAHSPAWFVFSRCPAVHPKSVAQPQVPCHYRPCPDRRGPSPVRCATSVGRSGLPRRYVCYGR